MKKIFSHYERFMVWQVKQLLEDNNIPCFIKNEYASGAMGELAPLDVAPEVWLHDDEWQSKAEKLIAEVQHDTVKKPEWYCQQCKEINDGSFELCWQCGTENQVLV